MQGVSVAERLNQQIGEMDQLLESWPGSDIHPVQTTRGRLHLRIDGAIDSALSVFRLSLAPQMIDHVTVDAGRTGFVLVESSMISMGVEIAAPTLLINQPGREYRSVLRPNFRSLEFIVSNHAIASHPLGDLLGDLRMEQEQTLVPLTARSADRLRSVACAYIAACDSGLESRVDANRSEVLRELTGLIAQFRGLSRAVPSTRASECIAFAALREIERVGVRKARMTDITRKLGVSRRTIEKSFDRVLSISPSQYLLACRLNALRLSLLGSVDRVADGLADAGLADASRAARQYRRLFGELPSDTLNRTQARF